jgi:hypothetical protein
MQPTITGLLVVCEYSPPGNFIGSFPLVVAHLDFVNHVLISLQSQRPALRGYAGASKKFIMTRFMFTRDLCITICWDYKMLETKLIDVSVGSARPFIVFIYTVRIKAFNSFEHSIFRDRRSDE